MKGILVLHFEKFNLLNWIGTGTALCTFWAQVFLDTRRELPLIFDERQFQISLSPSSLGPVLFWPVTEHCSR